MNLTAAAGLAGMTPAYLSMIERGLRPVTKRVTLEALAQALRVSPADLTGRPDEPSSAQADGNAPFMTAIEDALTGWWLGEVPDVPGRPWPEVAADLDRLNLLLRPNADYAGQGELLPVLIRDLLAGAV